MEELTNDISNVEIDNTPIKKIEVKPKSTVNKKVKNVQPVVQTQEEEKSLINCLRNERIIVRHINKHRMDITNPKHIMFGGMLENATKVYTVPRLKSGKFINVLTDDEKNYLEEVMGLEHNTLSVYKKDDNFWSDANPDGISKVFLKKQDNIFDLSDPTDYIKYKILLANKDFICPDLKTLRERPLVSYEFVIISKNADVTEDKLKMSNIMEAYKLFGNIEDDTDKLRTIVELLTGRPVASNSKADFLKVQINKYIQESTKQFLDIVKDKYLDAKILIKKAVIAGLISKRGNYYYYKIDNTPLCENNQEPTLDIAAQYIVAPKHSDLKLSLEAQVQ
jgi:hypothetical protein